MGGVQSDPDAIVIGSGPNGLVAGCVLARAGLDVLVLEANEARAGGAVGSEAATRPGFLHDVGAAFFPWAKLSPAFRSLPLEEHGLRWAGRASRAAIPRPTAVTPAICRGSRRTAAHFGNPEDGERWRRIASWYAFDRAARDRLAHGRLPRARPDGAAGAAHLARLGAVFLSRGARLSERWFTSGAARRVLPGLALHVDVGPDDRFGAALGFMLGMTATHRRLRRTRGRRPLDRRGTRRGVSRRLRRRACGSARG